jgi:microcystin-dependent protein
MATVCPWFPYSFAPYGWIECAGQTLAITQNTALFSLLGTNFGGNGTYARRARSPAD